jgi:glycosyltransferase involved in cell wall biosynthesis
MGSGSKSAPMNILFVTASYYPAVRYGGPIYTVHGLARALAARGNRVVVYTTDADGDRRVELASGQPHMLDGVEVHFYRSRIDRIYWSPEMISALDENAGKFDVVHAHAAFLYPTVAARRASLRAGVPFVYSPRGMLVRDLFVRKSLVVKTAWTLLFERANCRDAAFVHATSDLEALEMKKLGLRPKRVEVIFNAVDLTQIESEAAGDRRNPPDTDRFKPYVLSLGRVSWKKGLDRLIEAMAFVPSANLVVAGNDEEGYSRELQELAAKRGLRDRVFFVGPDYGRDKLDWFRNAVLFVLPSYSESFGVVAVEAMACGCPVVMTPEVGVAETITATGAGMTVSGEPAALGRSIDELLADPARRRRMGDIGREKAAELFCWSAVAESMEAAYRRSVLECARAAG